MFALPDLPYAADALAPVISVEALTLHHGKHHAGYLKALNTLIAERPGMTASLEETIIETEAWPDPKLFNNAAQCWNHSFFWLSMGSERIAPQPALSNAISAAFGDLAGLKAAFVAAGLGHFGSGWIWLMSDRGGLLSLSTTHDAHNPLTVAGATPLLVCDLWEHAYYLDHLNDRSAYLASWFDQLANWGFAVRQYAAAIGGGGSWRHPLPTRTVG